MADVNTVEKTTVPYVAKEMAERLQNLVNGSSELPWDQDYTGKENGVNLPLPVFGRNGTPLRGIPALYLSTVMQLRGLDDPRFFTFDMLKHLNDQLVAENKKLPAEEQKNINMASRKKQNLTKYIWRQSEISISVKTGQYQYLPQSKMYIHLIFGCSALRTS